MISMQFVDLWWRFLLLAIGAYLIGNVNFAIIISKAKNKDITKMGSGNPGTMNMSRQFGLGIGVLTLVLDILKGAIPTFVGGYLFRGFQFGASGLCVADVSMFLGGFFAVVGHIFPFWLHFKGGKGIATTIGVFLVAEPLPTVICGVIALVFILITAMGSMGSFIATTPQAIIAIWKLYKVCFVNGGVNLGDSVIEFIVGDILIIGIIALTWYAHRQNIVRLLSGEEHQTGWIDMIKEKKYKRKLRRLQKNDENRQNS